MKTLIEKKNALITQAEKMLNDCTTEVRGLNQEELTKYNELKSQIENVDATIKAFEERSKEDAVVEVVENQIKDKEERGNTMEKNKELEVRGIEQYLRKQEGEEVRTMTYSTNGGLVPEYLHGEVVKALPEVAPLFAKTPKLTPVSGTVRVARESDLGAAGFVGEDEEIAVNDVTMEFVELTQKRAGSAIEVSNKLINDAGINIVNYSTSLLFRRLGFALDRAMITGDGTKSIQGLKQAPVGCVVAPAGVGLAIEDLMNMAAQMSTVYQTGAVWVMNRANFNKLAVMKDGNGHFYVAREAVNDKIAYKLFGLEILINDVAGNDIFLVNFAHAYAAMLKKNVELKTVDGDRQSALKGTVTLVLDTYIDAKIVQPEAIKVLTVTEV